MTKGNDDSYTGEIGCPVHQSSAVLVNGESFDFFSAIGLSENAPDTLTHKEIVFLEA